MKQFARSTHLNNSPAALLYQRYASAIFAYLRLHTSLWEDAEDLLLEVFLAALEEGRLEAVPEEERLAWLRGVAHHKLVDSYRRHARRPATPLDALAEVVLADERLTPEASALRQEERRRLRAAVARLPTLQQQVLRLRFEEGLKSAQIAALLGKQDSAVRQLLARTLNTLRSLYQEQD
jgi:RNA polymerase sigma factor (sigma-70 family)